MNTIPNVFRCITSLALWGGTCGLFSLFVASGNLVFGAAIVCGLLLYVAMLRGPQLIASLWLMGTPTIFSLFNQVLKVLPFITMERVMFVVLSGMIVLRAVFVKTRSPSRSTLEVLIVLFLCYVLTSLMISAGPYTLRQDIWFFLQYAMPMLMFLISRRIDWSERSVKMLLAGLTMTGVLLAAIGVLQVLFGVTIFTMDYQAVTRGHVERAYGTFTNAHTYITALSVLLTVTILQFGIYRDSLVRFMLMWAMLAMIVAMLLGQTRAPWGGAAVTLFIILLRDRSVRSLLVAGGVVAVITGGAVLLLMVDELGSFRNRVTDYRTIEGRLVTWATALNIIAHNPVFGVGFGAYSFYLHKPEYMMGVGSLPAQYAEFLHVPHNEYLHVAVLSGILGLGLFLGIVYGLVRLMFRIHLDTDNSLMRRRLGLYVGAVVLGLLFSSMFSDTYLQDYYWILTYFLAGFVAGMPRDFGRVEGGAAWGGRRVEGAT